MRKKIQRHGGMSENENKTSTTLSHAIAAVTDETPVDSRPVTDRCGYVVAAGSARFCDRPVLDGGSYCARHRARCAVAPARPEFAALAQAQGRAGNAPALPPPELDWLRPPAALEPLDESDDERLAGLDLPVAELAVEE